MQNMLCVTDDTTLRFAWVIVASASVRWKGPVWCRRRQIWGLSGKPEIPHDKTSFSNGWVVYLGRKNRLINLESCVCLNQIYIFEILIFIFLFFCSNILFFFSNFFCRFKNTPIQTDWVEEYRRNDFKCCNEDESESQNTKYQPANRWR